MQVVIDSSSQALFGPWTEKEMTEPSPSRCRSRPRREHEQVAFVDVGALAAPAPGVLGRSSPQRVTHRLRLEQGQLRSGCERSRRANPHRSSTRPSADPARALAQQPGQLGDVRFFSPRPGARTLVPAGHLRARSRTFPPASIAASRAVPGTSLTRSSPVRSVPSGGYAARTAARGELLQAFHQVVAGSGAVAGHRRLPAERRAALRSPRQEASGDRRPCCFQPIPAASSTPAARARCWRPARTG